MSRPSVFDRPSTRTTATGTGALRRLHGSSPMKHQRALTIGLVTLGFALAGGLALSAQNKYTLKVPGGLAFSEFKGYEGWQAISMSRSERLVAVILGTPAMIDAYHAGIPENGKP